MCVESATNLVVLKTPSGKDGPVYAAEEFKNFCLVAVIGARERCLRDDFRPLHLQNPWKKGRLYVRQKKDVLAAIEQSGRQQQPQPAALWTINDLSINSHERISRFSFSTRFLFVFHPSSGSLDRWESSKVLYQTVISLVIFVHPT